MGVEDHHGEAGDKVQAHGQAQVVRVHESEEAADRKHLPVPPSTPTVIAPP